MRKSRPASAVASRTPLPAASSPTVLVCLGLSLALFALAARIASIW
jgi:hypothetical protein